MRSRTVLVTTGTNMEVVLVMVAGFVRLADGVTML